MLKKGKSNNWGGTRTGAGRPFEGKETQKIKIPEYAHTRIKKHLNMLTAKGGQSTSMQKYCSKIILDAVTKSKTDDWLQNISKEISPGTAPWSTLTLTAEAYCHLEILTKQISALSLVYTNLSNCFTAIILKQVSIDAVKLRLLAEKQKQKLSN